MDEQQHPRSRPDHAARVEELILELGLGPGDPLPTEAALGEQLGISRSSVRETMRVLNSLDIVTVRHGHGTFVGDLSLAPLVAGLVFRSRLNLDKGLRTLREVIQVRMALDLFLTDDVIRSHRSVDHGDLRATVERMETLSNEGKAFADQDAAFHSAIFEPIGNELVSQLVLAFWEIHSASLPLIGLQPSSDMIATAMAHRDILDALEEADAAGYRRAVRAHYEPLLRVLAEHAEQQ